MLKRKVWGLFTMVGALAITVYWPVVNLFYMLSANKTDDFAIPQSTITFYMVVLSLISLYGLWGIWYLYTHRQELVT
ncbi:hypothetical protein ACFL38_00885 [Candidatus Omnitrophota bacterium]